MASSSRSSCSREWHATHTRCNSPSQSRAGRGTGRVAAVSHSVCCCKQIRTTGVVLHLSQGKTGETIRLIVTGLEEWKSTRSAYTSAICWVCNSILPGLAGRLAYIGVALLSNRTVRYAQSKNHPTPPSLCIALRSIAGCHLSRRDNTTFSDLTPLLFSLPSRIHRY